MNTIVQIVLFAPLLAFVGLLMGTALTPGMTLLMTVISGTEGWALWARAFYIAMTVMGAYFIYGFAYMTLSVLFSRLVPKPSEGEYPYFSKPAILWLLNNALLFPASKTFLDFVPLSGINVIYYKLLGAKIGQGVQLNAQLVDCWLMEIEDSAVIGGGAVIVGHAAEGGLLKLKGVKIGKGATVGMGALVMPGAHIGEGALIGPHSVVLTGKKIPPHTTWVGVPVRPVRRRPY